MAYDDYMGVYREKNPYESDGSSPYRYPTTTQQQQTTTEEPATQPSATNYSSWGGSSVAGLDANKVQSGHDSPKYQIAKVLSNFDPTKGITGEVLNALNELNLGTFTGQDDKLYVGGNVDPRFGDVLSSDVVTGFKTGNGTWGAWGSPVGGGSTPAPTSTPYMPMSYTPSAPSAPSGANSLAGVTIVQEGGDGDPFAAMGGGVKLSNGSWVPKDSPLLAQLRGGVTGTSTSKTGIPASSDKDLLLQELRERMTQSLDVNPNDPVIKNQTEHFGAKTEDLRRRYLTEAAERNAAQGLGQSGKLLNEQRFADEQSARDQGSFQAELMGRELMSRRQEIQHALDSMANVLTESERQALQKELAVMDNALRRYGIDTQNSQYFAGLGQADRHFAAELAQRDRLAGSDDAFRNAQLGQSDSQFRDRLGFDVADRQAYWDALRRGIG
jgi:hypothetical protein